MSTGFIPAGCGNSPNNGPPTAKLGTVERDVIFATIDGVALKLDVYYPKTGSLAVPAVLYVHGGGWTAGDKRAGAGTQLIPELVSRGYLVAAINYRLAPDYKIPDQIGDVKCAVRYLREKAALYGIDPRRIGAVGGSAGGHLVALLGASDTDAKLEGLGGYGSQSSRVQAVVDLFGPADLPTMFKSAASPQIQRLFGATDPYSETVKKVSPVTHITRDDPPFLILHGDNDTTVPLEQSQILHEQLTAAGVNSTLVVVQNAGHSFRPVPDGAVISPTEREMTTMIADFFDRHLKK
jgi:acetyl esterase/lipase